MPILKILADTSRTGKWEYVDIPSTIGPCASRPTVIVFSDSEGTMRHHRVPYDIKKPNRTVEQYVDGLTPSEAHLGELTIEQPYVTFESLDRNAFKLRKAKLGWNPDASTIDEVKDSILISKPFTDGRAFGENKLYTFGGHFCLPNLSTHGVFLAGARRLLETRHDTVGVWDFEELGGVDAIPFHSVQVINITDRGFDYTYPIEDGDDFDSVSYLWVFGGRIHGYIDPVTTEGDGVLRFPLSTNTRIHTFLDNHFRAKTLYGVEPIHHQTRFSSYATNDVVSDQTLLAMLSDPLSFIIKIHTPNLTTELVSILNRSPHILIPSTQDRFPVVNEEGLSPEYTITKGIDTEVYNVPYHTLNNNKVDWWYESNDSVIMTSPDPFDPIHANPSRLLKIHCTKLRLTQ